MYLKRIEVQGFKSFAGKIEIEFRGGITGVVGPNGSGKSNISDAIRWVLGEQSVKTLRGSKMEDVIFAGTSKRKPLGFAEVTLVLDNKDGKLPIEYTEVSITRRVFRSGESEYYINKVSCRLKDIRELFMDTGVGKDGYSIIGQGRIDEILSTKSEDRRNIFEEAAGIVKYKSRKEEATKKLEKTRENLTRINDIVNELDSQLDPLEQQAVKATRYLELKENLKNIEVSLFVREIDRLREQLSLLENQKELITKQLEYNEDQRDKLEGKYNLVKNEIEKMDSNIENIQGDKYKIQNSIEKNEAELRLYDEKINIFTKEKVRFNEELKEIQKRINEIVDKEKTVREHKVNIENRIFAITKELDEKQTEYDKLTNSIFSKEKYIEDKKSDVIDILNKIADKKSQLNSIVAFNQNIDKRIKQIDKEIIEVLELKQNNEIKYKKSIAEIEKQNSEMDILLKRKNKYKDTRENLEKKLNEFVHNISKIKESIQGKVSRYALIKDMKNEYEGFYKSVKNTLIAVKNNMVLGVGVHGVVAELIKVDKSHEKAIEVALGSVLQNIVTETEENAKNIISYMKKHNLGRVTFLPMSSMNKRVLTSAERRLVKKDGLVGIASELIEYNDKYHNIINYLLGRVVIVRSIDDGIAIAKASNYSFKIVSLDGDVINPGGSITGGSYNSNYTSLLSRDRQLTELNGEIEDLNVKQRNLENELTSLKKEIFELNSNITNTEIDINNLKLTLSKLESNRLQGAEENSRLESLIKKYESEKRQLLEENSDSLVNAQKLESELEGLRETNSSTKVNIEAIIEDYEKEKNNKEKVQKEITELKVRLATFEQEFKSTTDIINKHNEDKQRLYKEMKYKEEKYLEDEKEISLINDKIEVLKKLQVELRSNHMEKDIKLKEIKGDKNNYLQTFYAEQEKLKDMNRNINDLQKSINTLEIKYTKYSTQLENIINRLWDEYELSYQMAVKFKSDIENVTKIQNEIREIRNGIKSLGSINVGAIEEFERIKERYEFLSNQKEDLVKGKESLHQVIKNMEKMMKEQFIEQFYIIKENFVEVFSRLFGGGKADVYLEDESDILNSGIEIIAQPPGKKLQSMSLLSGGERALTAIALLFAILKTKPTPFCILDEIEAALDDANVYRFAEYLKDFSKATQFIVITHRKGTMESVDSLYGVTMEEEGVTKLVSVKLSDKISEKAS